MQGDDFLPRKNSETGLLHISGFLNSELSKTKRETGDGSGFSPYDLFSS